MILIRTEKNLPSRHCACLLGDERERVDEGVGQRLLGFCPNLRLVVAIWQIIVLQRGLVRWELSLKFSHEANGLLWSAAPYPGYKK